MSTSFREIFSASFFTLLFCIFFAASCNTSDDGKSTAEKLQSPNIVIILADDLGYGDVQAYNPDSRIPTPHMNTMAESGIQLMNAHTDASVCSPTRYGLLTGRYSWRTRLKRGVLWPPAEPLIDKNRETLATLMHDAGYHTAVVGKWHLGLDWVLQEDNRIDFNQPIKNTPNDHGFDESFIFPGSADMAPYTFVENRKVVETPSRSVSDTLFGQAGLAIKDLQPEDILSRFTRKAKETITRHAKQNEDQQLFLYFPLTAPHKPVAPAERFQGKTELGDYGDFVYQVDWTVGQIIETLKKHGMYENTLLIVTSDNGTSPNAAGEAMEMGHDVNGPFRGLKATVWEGGHRVPFIATWPGVISGNTKSDRLVSLNDMMATFAELTDQQLSPESGVDSYNILPLLKGHNPDTLLRPAAVMRSGGGCLGLLAGNLKLAQCPGSGSGWAGSPTTGEAREQGLPPVQLYNLKQDTGETRNLQDVYPSKVDSLRQILNRYIDRGRSTSGPRQQNWRGKTSWKQLNWR